MKGPKGEDGATGNPGPLGAPGMKGKILKVLILILKW
jgi:hypothetical protein